MLAYVVFYRSEKADNGLNLSEKWLVYEWDSGVAGNMAAHHHVLRKRETFLVGIL